MTGAAVTSGMTENDSVALLLADQRMPRMDGVEFLQQAMRIYPEAKRALLTAYADTSAAISAINEANINYFFLKPWDPPADRLYPQLDDLLDDWQASYHPTFDGIRVLGTSSIPGFGSASGVFLAMNMRVNGGDRPQTPERLQFSKTNFVIFVPFVPS